MSDEYGKIRMGDLTCGELAIWENSKGTQILFYVFESGCKYMRVLWASTNKPFAEFGVFDDEWMCTPLHTQTTEDPIKALNDYLSKNIGIVRELLV